jgi:ribulose-phosphate 3-epimerase
MTSGTESETKDEESASRWRHFRALPAPIVTPSLLGNDFSRVGAELAAVEEAGAAAVHLDVMDGHFVPNLTYGPPLIADWRRVTQLPFDAHLMVSDPARHVDAFLDAGCDSLTIHIEAVPHPQGLLKRIHNAGRGAGLALNPPTPIEAVWPYIDVADSILVMSVMPGFGGQAFDVIAFEKIAALRRRRPDLRIAVDGGIKQSNAAEVTASGATQLVVGSAIFDRTGHYAANLESVLRAARRGLGGGELQADSATQPSPV